jgi:hypothetical protein
MPEERACLGKYFKDTLGKEEFMLIVIDRYFGFFRSILVVQNKVKVAEIFMYTMDKPQMGTALPALVALKPHTPDS